MLTVRSLLPPSERNSPLQQLRNLNWRSGETRRSGYWCYDLCIMHDVFLFLKIPFILPFESNIGFVSLLLVRTKAYTVPSIDITLNSGYSTRSPKLNEGMPIRKEKKKTFCHCQSVGSSQELQQLTQWKKTTEKSHRD